MSYSDYCDYDGYLEFYHETFPSGRKEHSCVECGKKIPIGEKHLYCRSKMSGGDFWTARQCLDCRDFCMEIRDKLMEGSACLDFGGLEEFLNSYRTDIPSDTAKDRKKFALIRSKFAVWLWEKERIGKPFWKPKTFEHREIE